MEFGVIFGMILVMSLGWLWGDLGMILDDEFGNDVGIILDMRLQCFGDGFGNGLGMILRWFGNELGMILDMILETAR